MGLPFSAAEIEGIEHTVAIDELMRAGMKMPMGFNRGPAGIPPETRRGH